ncbi:alpha/beta fold hydrolase [Galactobacter valiniphilus]|uniref:alpha/beta fold hydrolase n=1 Tax=Galactobacter valiniphilus TaxID=2676122 RepID=UPI001F3C4C01|nr:alpha/beta fold hydrolase [Galactobacter valiniphilus]
MADWETWLPAVLGEEPVDLIGHSIGAGAAVTAAEQFPDRIRSLPLIAPFFLQVAVGPAMRLRPLVRTYLRHADAARLSRQLTGSEGNANALESSAQDLRRTSAGHVAQYLAHAGSTRWRAELREALARFAGPVRIITGSADPLAPDAVTQFASRPNVELISLPGAGHHPQLTHASELAGLLHK